MDTKRKMRTADFEVHETALLSLGLCTALALLTASGFFSAVLFEVLGATILYASLLFVFRERKSKVQQRVLFLASYAFVVWFYCAVARITPALGTKLRDGSLLAIDEAIFGQTPAVFCERVATAWLTDLMSLCYLTYHFYLVLAVAQAAWIAGVSTQRLSASLFMGFAIGFAGYLLVPAVGPIHAHPELFRASLPGGTLSRVIAQLVTKGSSGFDVFPSLHVLITCILLHHDWRHLRRRFWIMAVPSLGLWVSTLYLRYHYGIDLLAAFLVFLTLRQTFAAITKVGDGKTAALSTQH